MLVARSLALLALGVLAAPPGLAAAEAVLCGRGSYTAVEEGGAVTLSAEIMLPTPGYKVLFREGPERIAPPIMEFRCETPSDIVPQVLTPYRAEATVRGAAGEKEIRVRDALGEISVPVAVPPKICGGIAGVPCEQDEFCRFEDGTCGIADRQGECQAKPAFCTMDWNPVCGCDGKTYSNRCHAHAVGESIDKKGECKP